MLKKAKMRKLHRIPVHEENRLIFGGFALVILGIALTFAGCAWRKSAVPEGIQSLLSPELQRKIQSLMESVVEVVNVREYRIEQFNYELQDGRFIPDSQSPVGYRLRGGSMLYGVTFDKKINKIYGAGLLLFHDDRRALILTSSHLVSPPDTVVTYYSLPGGDSNLQEATPSKVMFSRAIAVSGDLSVRQQNQSLQRAELLAEDKRADIALITTRWRPGLGVSYAYDFAYKQPAAVGEVALAVGYPEEIKQVTFGMVSNAPYRGNFSLGIVGRFGFSGAPVFLIRQGAELSLAGVGRGAPVVETAIIAPPSDFVTGYYLQPEDLSRLRVERLQQINYGLIYAIDIQRIGDFITSNLATLEKHNFYLLSRFVPSDR